MPYVDGFVIPIKKRKLALYRRMARLGAKVWLDHGALEYRECIGDDLKAKGVMPFNRLAKLKAGETVMFSWIVYRSKAQRDRVNARVMKDPRMTSIDWGDSPFNMKRMAYGGFKVMVEGMKGGRKRR